MQDYLIFSEDVKKVFGIMVEEFWNVVSGKVNFRSLLKPIFYYDKGIEIVGQYSNKSYHNVSFIFMQDHILFDRKREYHNCFGFDDSGLSRMREFLNTLFRKINFEDFMFHELEHKLSKGIELIRENIDNI